MKFEQEFLLEFTNCIKMTWQYPEIRTIHQQDLSFVEQNLSNEFVDRLHFQGSNPFEKYN